MRTADLRQLDEQSRTRMQASDANFRRLLGQDSQRTSTLEKEVRLGGKKLNVHRLSRQKGSIAYPR